MFSFLLFGAEQRKIKDLKNHINHQTVSLVSWPTCSTCICPFCLQFKFHKNYKEHHHCSSINSRTLTDTYDRNWEAINLTDKWSSDVTHSTSEGWFDVSSRAQSIKTYMLCGLWHMKGCNLNYLQRLLVKTTADAMSLSVEYTMSSCHLSWELLLFKTKLF